MKMLALAIATVGLTLLLAMTTPIAHGGTATTPNCAAGKPHQALMTSKVLRIWNRPIYVGYHNRSKGPIWDPDFNARPGQGQTMVIDAHDVTRVPGYGAHGPSYRLPFAKPGDKLAITRCGVRYTYHYIEHSTPWQCDTKRASMNPMRYTGQMFCFTNNSSIKEDVGETLYMRGCWPRYTDYKFFLVRWALISARRIS